MTQTHEDSATDLRVGLDVGSTSVKVVVVDPAGVVLGRAHEPLAGELSASIRRALGRLAPTLGDNPVRLGLTGQGRLVLGRLPGAVVENEILALLAGAGALKASARSIIEIGGQNARFIVLEHRAGTPALAAFALNDQCAAGAGAFLTQQASRLKMDIGDFARAADAAKKGATIAGRCAVFAKSDMVHLQQKGVGLDDIAYGLCLALARNFLATVLKGHKPPWPIGLAGGGALNLGLVRAFREVLEVSAESLVVLADPLYVGAVGAAALAARATPVSLAAVVAQVATPPRRATGRAAAAARPVAPPTATPGPLPRAAVPGDFPAWLGVDVGSVSTDFALVAPDGTLLDGVYLPTRGRPIDVLREGLGLLADRYGGRLRVLGVGTTGSGRHLAGRLLGADLVRNEITAQLEGALHEFPEADCIFEIGGQDSKYIRIEHGRVADFTMNKVCAAGTGSFLEEQCENLGIDVKTDFARLAAESRAPADLGSRCTVFMETELVNARRAGAGLPDLCAGLALAVARNYLSKVVVRSPIGRRVVFQGGVAGNAAVRAAFEELLGRPIAVHPHSGLSGAIGIALIAREAGITSTSFKGLGAVAGQHESRTFECPHCENRCEVAVVRVGGQKTHFGDTCERYTVRDAGRGEAAAKVPDLFAERDALLSSFVGNGAGRTSVGLPRASMLLEYLPFWATLLTELGLRIVLSPPSSSRILELGNRHLPAETCLPIKMTFGHVAALKELGPDFVLVPSVVTLDDPTRRTGQVCPFTSAAPFMARAAVDDRILIPALVLGKRFQDFAEEMLPWCRRLGVSENRLETAYEGALGAQAAFRQAQRTRGEALLATEFDHALVVVGRPYNLGDPFLNLNLARHLTRLGVLAFPQGFLPADQTDLGEHDGLPWRFPRDAMRAALHATRDPRLHPVLVTNFGCGLDAFVSKYLADALGARAPLVLEFDEHRGEAGMVTRIEAYLDRVHAAAAKPVPALRPRPQGPAVRLQGGGPIYVPYVADHAYALVGTLRYLGAEARLLPLPDDASVALGEEASSGKECHAYAMVAGDLLRLARDLDPSERASFFIFGTTTPCLLTQFSDGLGLVLRERGITNLRVASPASRETLGLFGLKGALRLWRGLVATDLLTRWRCETRPYETTPGSTDAAHQANLEDLCAALAGDDVAGFIDRALARAGAVAVDRSRPRPVVGVAGDIYTRINPAANQDLFRTLESMGCEVWPCSFLVDTMDFAMANAIVRTFKERDYPEVMLNVGLTLRKEAETWRMRRRLARLVRGPDEPSYRETMRLASPYVGRRSIENLLLSVGKMVQFAREGADGILHAICLNCMLGTASAALLERIRRDYRVPVVNLVYAASETAAHRTRLEAFVHQVRAYHEERLARAPTRHRFGLPSLFGGA